MLCWHFCWIKKTIKLIWSINDIKLYANIYWMTLIKSNPFYNDNYILNFLFHFVGFTFVSHQIQNIHEMRYKFVFCRYTLYIRHTHRFHSISNFVAVFFPNWILSRWFHLILWNKYRNLNSKTLNIFAISIFGESKKILIRLLCFVKMYVIFIYHFPTRSCFFPVDIERTNQL